MPLKYDKQLSPRAKELRKGMTRQERHLWYDYLSTYPVRFQRQKTIARFIVDFYCHQASLVVELDGSQHYYEKAFEYDDMRTASFEECGILVLRFTNKDIDDNFEGVCSVIGQNIKERAG